MERDRSAHPTAAQIASGKPLTEEQLASLTPEQREVLTAPRPLLDDGDALPATEELAPEELDGDVESDYTPGADNGFVDPLVQLAPGPEPTYEGQHEAG